MPLVDMPLSQLREYMPNLTKEADFDEFWTQEWVKSNEIPLNDTLTRIEYPVSSVDVYDVAYDGADGAKVHGLYVVPKEALANRPMSVVVSYQPAAYNNLLTEEKEAKIYYDYSHEGLPFHKEAMMHLVAKHL
jgi:cephalosporin-C deacetylase